MTISLLIISAGGLGREYYYLARAVNKEAEVAYWDHIGFLDDRPEILKGKRLDNTLILGSPDSYTPGSNDCFICAIGDPVERERYSNMIDDKGGVFAKLISPSAKVTVWRDIMPGTVISPFSLISCDTIVGRHCFINSHAILGHDVRLGDYCHVGAGAHIGGNAVIGSHVTIHPNATVLPGVEIGDKAVIGAGSVVIRRVKSGETVFGVPASVVHY